jgi:hypothetical protein
LAEARDVLSKQGTKGKEMSLNWFRASSDTQEEKNCLLDQVNTTIENLYEVGIEATPALVADILNVNVERTEGNVYTVTRKQ